MEQKDRVVETVDKAEEKVCDRKQELEALCKKIMGVVIPCICLMLLVLTLFRGSGEARDVKRALKSEGCDVKLLTAREDISEFLESIDLEMKNVEEAVVAVDDDDPDLFFFVLFFESRSDAEEAEEEIFWLLFGDPDAERYRVERNGKAVCFGYIDFVDVAMEALD